jgi:TM2 domain-containing membrane protein YozV
MPLPHWLYLGCNENALLSLSTQVIIYPYISYIIHLIIYVIILINKLINIFEDNLSTSLG